MCPKNFLHLHIRVLIHDFSAWGLHRWSHKKSESIQYVRDTTCSFIQVLNPFYDVFRFLQALKEQEQKFWKKTFGVPRIVNLENGNEFCIFKKIRNERKYFFNTWFSSFFDFCSFYANLLLCAWLLGYNLTWFLQKNTIWPKTRIIDRILSWFFLVQPLGT